MHKFTIVLLLTFSSLSFAQQQKTVEIDPDSVDTELAKVMYVISPNDIKVSSYRSGSPSAFKLKLCENCRIKTYQLADNAELLLNEAPLKLSDLTINLIKKKFDVIQLGIDRSNHTVSYLYLGGMNESSTEELEQEQSDEN